MFTYYEPDTAPEESKPLMEQSLAGFGMIPNLHKILAEAPATYKAYNQTFTSFMKETTFSPVEQQVVFMTSNFENNCHYCVPGHTWMMKSSKMPDDLIEALRNGTKLPDAKLQALHDFTKALLDNRGHIGDDKLNDFLNAGYTKRQALEVLTGLASKLISNFTNALTHTEVDDAMKPYAGKSRINSMSLENHPMWRLPMHHLDHEDAHDHVHWVELFYDLIHVVIIFLLGNFLSDHLSVDGFLAFAGLFIAVWFAWADSSVFNSLYISTDVKHRLIMSCQIVTAMVMAASIPHVLDKGWMYFALAYSANRMITAYLYHRTNRLGVEATVLSRTVSRNFFVLAIVFAISAFLPAPYNFSVFALAILSIQLLYMLPKIGVLECKRFLPRLGHMSERFALLLLIVVGEGFFKLVITLSEKGVYKVTPEVLFNFMFGGIAVFVHCWIYFDFVGNGKPKNQEKWTLVNWWLAHLFLMLSAVMVGVALAGEVKVGFWDPYPFKYGVIGCIGLASYLLCLLWIQFNIEKRIAHRFATAKVRMFGVVLALATLLVLPYVPALVGNLLWGTALISQIAIPVTRAFLTFSKEEQARA